MLAASGSLALVLGTTPFAAAPLPALSPDGACAPAAPAAPAALAAPGGGAAVGGAGAGGPRPEALTEALADPGSDFAPATGTVTALTVFIDFPGTAATVSTRERFAEFFPATSGYFAASSLGRLRYRPVPVHRWLRMSQPFASYGIDRGSGWHPRDRNGYNRLMREIVSALGDEVDVTAYDLVNVLATPQAGPPATEKVLSVTFPGVPLVETPTGSLRNVSFIWSRQPGQSPYRVLVHENGHSFGLPDLYWTGPGAAPPLAGHWDVMQQDWGPANDLLAWHKWKLGWLSGTQVACATRPGVTEHVLTPAGRPGQGTKLVVVGTGPHTALALEVRAPGGLDRLVCRPGVLVSRVDAAAPSGAGPIRVADATPGSGGCQHTPDPQVTAALTDAPFVSGETFRDERTGVTVQVLGARPDGSHRIRLSVPHPAA